MTVYPQNCSRSNAVQPAGLLDILTQSGRQWMENQWLKSRIARERRQLLAMSSDLLDDIGISRSQAETEALRTDLPVGRLIQVEC